MIVRNSFRALGACLIPLVILHILMLAAVTMGRFGSGAPGDLPSADQMLRVLAGRVLLDALLLLTLHRFARRARRSDRGLYAGLGALAAGLSYAAAVSAGFWPLTPIPGAVMAAGLLPVAFGALAGFLYQHGAGLEALPDQAAAQARADAQAEAFESYDGPLQVRSSAAAFAICSAMPAFFLFLAAMLMVFPSVSGLQFGGGGMIRGGAFTGAAFSLQMFVGAAVISCLPTLVFVYINHGLLRALKRTEVLAYAAMGGIVAGLLVLIFSTGMLKIGALPAAVCGAIMMAVYRRLAGLEPQALPEAVIVRDPATLVGAGAPARRGRMVVRTR